ncbi:hypothetical protein PC118_g1163 [Phytophthora cactorum]|uniref:RxLR effector protein n=1 Tax=Phytophthora cactorum TaxID=29920 RepID=A0A8T1A1X2_9STRA|nr:hypothetical protein GQ600_5352 [Phytophthora cactorum]KAG2869244.1 hypothetical protein PC113_g367 [Phytophthora cactorum]KAG2998766.1 hypothetical protein PC118_g1163 [Phytophthora cactorum]KAG3193502.1 hypothetical protein C6341_g121 [Phytophthora cactorum]KAG3206469.1 hypothetical protein PC128_g672 [Phytophthora cactorum]
MRLPYVLLLAVCVVIVSCDALSAFDYEQEAAATQNAQLPGSPGFLAAAQPHDTSGKRLLRSEFVPADDAVDDEEERGIPGLSKLKDVVQKGKTKVNDQVLWRNYRSMLKTGFSDRGITEAWINQGKTSAKIFDRWIRLGKSERQAAKNLLKEGKSPEELFTVLKSRGMSIEGIWNVWSGAGLEKAQLSAILTKLAAKN